jgi:hypothetical protein
MEDEVPNAGNPTGFLLFHMLAAIDAQNELMAAAEGIST